MSNFAKNGILNNQKSVDDATEFLSEFLVSSAEKAGNNGISITFNGQKKGEQRNWKFRKKIKRKIVKPKWHDATCESLSKKIKHSAFLLKKYPNNSYIRGCIQAEYKQYRKLTKTKHKH